MSGELQNGKPVFHPKTRRQWRSWLQKHHRSEKGIWLILPNQKSTEPGVSYVEAVEEALCFGWIDSIKKKRDTESSYQFFSPRKPRSTWSKINRERVERLLAGGLITESGQKMIDLAKKTGTWEAMEDAENLLIPPDLQKLFDGNKKAYANFLAFPPSHRKFLLGWIINAKRPETRQKRLQDTVKMAEENQRPL